MNRQSNKTFAIYEIKVSRENLKGECLATWNLMRRYSDFLDLHELIQKQFPNLVHLTFPGKKTFNNLDSDFLEKRRKSLNSYLQVNDCPCEYLPS